MKSLKDLCSTNDVHAPMIFILKNGSNYELGIEKINIYKDTYKNIDIDTELKKARLWLIDNPVKRKTSRGMGKFLNGWLNRCDEKQKPIQQEKDWRDDYV